MSLRVKFWGTRGSIPAPGPRTVRYGGNTPCVELRTPTDRLVILDAGTGIRELGQSLVADAPRTGAGAAISADIFLTHTHWDHIQGVPFFGPMLAPGNQFMFWGPKGLDPSIDRVLRDQMAHAVFPVPMDELPSLIDYCTIGDSESRTGDGFTVCAFTMRHPGGAAGYRFADADDSASSLVYISDNELVPNSIDPEYLGWRRNLEDFVRGASLLIHDAMYTTDEYELHRGWGHSTVEAAVHLAMSTEVKQLALFHHHANRSDDEIDRCLDRARELVSRQGATLVVTAAAEGATLST